MTAPNAIELVQRAAQARAQLLSPGAPFELEMVTHQGQQVPAYKNALRNLPELINAGRAHGAREFMVYGDDRWSFARFFTAVDALAGRLQQEHGLQPGERVAIALRNRPEWAVAFAAVALVGAIPAPLNSFGLGEELSASLQDIEPHWLVCDQDRFDRLAQHALPDGCQTTVVDSGGGTVAWERLTAAGGPALVPPRLAATDPALILFTSGASAQAKGVLSNQRAVCQALHNIDYIGAIAGMTSPQAVQKLMAAGLTPTTLTVVPLFHVSGLHAQLLASLRHGRRLVLMHRWDPAQAMALIQREKITQFNGAPSMVQQLLDQPAFHDPQVSGTLMGLGFGGAGLSQRLIEDTLKARPDSLSGIGFGLTETNGVGAGASGTLFALRPQCAGMLSPLMELRIADVFGDPLPTGQDGEIWLRGVTVMEGYWNQPRATQAAMSEGWFRTGDVGLVDGDGFLRIVDRIKDVINRNGEKIAAAEVESCLMQHGAVEEAVVFAQADEQTGEAVVAVVHLRAGANASPEELRQHVAGRLAAYKVPQTIHLRSESLPRNPAGKLLKNTLKKEYQPR
ncbi:class I adenylate-forming enzyme family protein [Alicycliphilus denitrificans]|uniref:class I adenylate-forming enzyme family protein n=1 Tax=Alicycliphilus denitrificans TaxID=179636 RepID=UPI00384E29BE